MLPAALGLVGLEQALLARSVLNTKDLARLVGTESGTPLEYLLNVWNWDGAILLLFAVSLPCLVLGIQILARRVPRRTTR